MTQDHVVLQEKFVSHTESLVAELTGKAVQMVNIISGPHHHLKGRDQFTAGSTIPGGTKEPQVVSAAKNEICFCVKS